MRGSVRLADSNQQAFQEYVAGRVATGMPVASAACIGNIQSMNAETGCCSSWSLGKLPALAADDSAYSILGPSWRVLTSIGSGEFH